MWSPHPIHCHLMITPFVVAIVKGLVSRANERKEPRAREVADQPHLVELQAGSSLSAFYKIDIVKKYK